MEIYVCIGSSCHLKGSYDIIELLKDNLKIHNLENDVNMKASFCLGKCTKGVTIKVDDEIITGVSKDNFNEIFKKHILKSEQ
ncbi:MAG: NAD(P)H-dependent oxidoreductase subunit E [Oscillospiraceae bacterium]|jgi:NADH-quinone oxidoreductase subunit G